VRLDSSKSSFLPSPISTPQNSNILLENLPTQDPEIEGVLWNNEGIPEVSKGPMA
jgi:hypothetical protein